MTYPDRQFSYQRSRRVDDLHDAAGLRVGHQRNGHHGGLENGYRVRDEALNLKQNNVRINRL